MSQLQTDELKRVIKKTDILRQRLENDILLEIDDHKYEESIYQQRPIIMRVMYQILQYLLTRGIRLDEDKKFYKTLQHLSVANMLLFFVQQSSKMLEEALSLVRPRRAQSIYNLRETQLYSLDYLHRKYFLANTEFILYSQAHMLNQIGGRIEDPILIYSWFHRQLKQQFQSQELIEEKGIILIQEFLRKFDCLRRDLFERNELINEQLLKYSSKLQQNQKESTDQGKVRTLLGFLPMEKSNVNFSIRKVSGTPRARQNRLIDERKQLNGLKTNYREFYNVKLVTLNDSNQSPQSSFLSNIPQGVSQEKYWKLKFITKSSLARALRFNNILEPQESENLTDRSYLRGFCRQMPLVTRVVQQNQNINSISLKRFQNYEYREKQQKQFLEQKLNTYYNESSTLKENFSFRENSKSPKQLYQNKINQRKFKEKQFFMRKIIGQYQSYDD